MKNLLIVLFGLVLFGCKDIQCPAFPERLLAYFPHQKEDILKFTNTNNDTLEYKVKDTEASGPSSYGWNCKCACGSQAYIEIEPNDQHSLKLSEGISISNNPYITNIGCVFYEGDSITDSFAWTVTNKNPYTNDNSSFFGDSIIIEEEDNTRISKVIIVEGKGIVEFFDKKENCNWIRIE